MCLFFSYSAFFSLSFVVRTHINTYYIKFHQTKYHGVRIEHETALLTVTRSKFPLFFCIDCSNFFLCEKCCHYSQCMPYMLHICRWEKTQTSSSGKRKMNFWSDYNYTSDVDVVFLIIHYSFDVSTMITTFARSGSRFQPDHHR